MSAALIPQNLKGKVAIITGASSGIGRETALELARRGAAVVVGARRVADLEKLATEIEALGSKALAVKLDVTDEKDQANIVQQALKAFGGLHIAFNNAGLYLTGSITDFSVADFERMQRVNVIGVFLSMKYQIPAMKASKGDRVIINNSSFGGVMTSKALVGTAPYVATKSAVAGLSEQVACEVSDFGIRVLHVAPGFTVSDQLPADKAAVYAAKVNLPGFQKPIEPIDIAKAVAFLASDDARFITATSLLVAGGALKA